MTRSSCRSALQQSLGRLDVHRPRPISSRLRSPLLSTRGYLSVLRTSRYLPRRWGRFRKCQRRRASGRSARNNADIHFAGLSRYRCFACRQMSEVPDGCCSKYRSLGTFRAGRLHAEAPGHSPPPPTRKAVLKPDDPELVFRGTRPHARAGHDGGRLRAGHPLSTAQETAGARPRFAPLI